jgi:hypothetical protein
LPKRKGQSFTAVIIRKKPFWTVWPMLADSTSLAAIHRIKGVKEETVCEWLQRAAQHVEEIEALLLAIYPVSRVQLDAFWTYVGYKGEKGRAVKKKSEAAFGGAWPSLLLKWRKKWRSS